MAGIPTTFETMPSKLDILEEKVNRLVPLSKNSLLQSPPTTNGWT